jgi:hypothetical protein
MKNLGLAVLFLGLLLAGCAAGPNADPRQYAPYDDDYRRHGGTPTN